MKCPPSTQSRGPISNEKSQFAKSKESVITGSDTARNQSLEETKRGCNVTADQSIGLISSQDDYNDAMETLLKKKETAKSKSLKSIVQTEIDALKRDYPIYRDAFPSLSVKKNKTDSFFNENPVDEHTIDQTKNETAAVIIQSQSIRSDDQLSDMAAGKIRVLIAEDTYVHLALLGYMLTQKFNSAKLEQKLTGDGYEAIEELLLSFLRQTKNSEFEGSSLYDLLILDYSMPIMDGLKVAKIFRAICMAADIPIPPIIILTAYAKDWFEEGVFEANNIVYMRKPINTEDLGEVLKKLNFI